MILEMDYCDIYHEIHFYETSLITYRDDVLKECKRLVDTLKDSNDCYVIPWKLYNVKDAYYNTYIKVLVAAGEAHFTFKPGDADKVVVYSENTMEFS